MASNLLMRWCCLLVSVMLLHSRLDIRRNLESFPRIICVYGREAVPYGSTGRLFVTVWFCLVLLGSCFASIIYKHKARYVAEDTEISASIVGSG